MHRKHLRATVTGTDVDIPIGTLAAGQFLRFFGGEITTGIAGDVIGPASATDLAIARFDGASGRLIQNSVVLISDVGQVTGVTALNGRDIARWTDGPAVGSVGNNNIATWDGTTGRLLKDSTLNINNIVYNFEAEAVTGHLPEFGDSTGRNLIDSGIISDHVVTCAGTSTDNAITRWDGTNGKVIQNSVVLISDTGQVTGVTALNTRDIARWTDGPSIGGATDNAVARWDATTGRLLQNSVVVIDDTGAITGVTSINGTEWTGDYVRGPTPATTGQYNLAIWSDTGARDIMDGLLHIENVVRTFESEVTSQHLPMYSDSFGREIEDSGIVAAHVVTSAFASTDNAITRWDGTSGNVIQDSDVFISDTGDITGLVHLTMAGNINGRDPDSFVEGPASATDNRVARFDSTTGKLIQQSAVTIDDSGNLTGVGTINGSALATGDVVGPASATDNAVARFDSTTGKLIQNSVVIVTDAGAITGVTTLNGTAPSTWVRGPSSAFDSNVALFSGTDGKAIYDSGVALISGSLSSVVNITMSGNLNSRDPDGFVTGPSSSTHNVIACFNGTTGKSVYQGGSTVTLSGTTIANVTSIGGKSISSLVQGPGAATAFNIPRFADTTGALLQDSGIAAFALAQVPSPFGDDNRVVRTDTVSGSRMTQQSAVAIDDSGNITGAGTLNTRTIANWVDGPASATDNRAARFDGTTGKLIQNSAVTISDTGDVSGIGALSVVSINSVVPENHRLRHLGGGSDSVIDGSSWAAGDLIAYNGSGTQFTRVTQASLTSTGLTGNVLGTTAATVTTTVAHGGTGTIAVAGIYAIVCEIPYGLIDTGGTIIIGASWSSATVDVVGFSVGAAGGLITSSGGTVSAAKSAIPGSGIIRFVCRASVSAGGLVAFQLGRTGTDFTIYNGFTSYVII